MLKEERHQKLLKVLAEKEFATLEELSKSLLVSMPTIRRDLTELARRKLIIRNHGGAMHIPTENVIAPVDFRKSVNYKKKNLLARAAVKFALNNMVVFLDGSTTASYLCDYLKGRPDIIVITNSLTTGAHLKSLGLRTYCLGGEVIGSSSSVGGAMAIETAANFNIDVMFFSASGVNEKGMIVDTSEKETELRAFLLKNAAVSVFLCDGSKFGHSAVYNIASLSEIDYMITDSPVPESYPSPKKEIILVEEK